MIQFDTLTKQTSYYDAIRYVFYDVWFFIFPSELTEEKQRETIKFMTSKHNNRGDHFAVIIS